MFLYAWQAEEDAYPMYSPLVETEAVPAEEVEVPADEDTDGPSWFLVVCSEVLRLVALAARKHACY